MTTEAIFINNLGDYMKKSVPELSQEILTVLGGDWVSSYLRDGVLTFQYFRYDNVSALWHRAHLSDFTNIVRNHWYGRSAEIRRLFDEQDQRDTKAKISMIKKKIKERQKLGKAVLKSRKKLDILTQSLNVGKFLRNRAMKFAKNLESSGFRKEIIEVVSTHLNKTDFESTLDTAHPDCMSIEPKKVINMKTMELRDRCREDLCTYEAPVYFIEGDLPNATKYFRSLQTSDETVEYLREVLGYMLTGSISDRSFFVFYGAGCNGKSFLCELMESILGKMFYTMPKSLVVAGGGQRGGPCPELVCLNGPRMAVFSEGETADKQEINISLFKQISGGDPLSARQLYKNQQNFQSRAKLLLLSNFRPRLTAEKAIIDRLRYVFFDNDFGKVKKKTIDWVESLRTDTTLRSEIFSYLVAGASRVLQRGKIKVPETVKKRIMDLISSDDGIDSFITGRVSQTGSKKDYIRRSDLFESFKEFCDSNSHRCQPRSTLYERLDQQKIGYPSKKDGYDVYRGIRLKSEHELLDDDDDDDVAEMTPVPIDQYSVSNSSEVQALRDQIKEQNEFINMLQQQIRDLQATPVKQEPEHEDPLSDPFNDFFESDDE